MIINLHNTGKRYNREWIFRNFNFTFYPNNNYGIIGNNGSGKSTLLQVIAGAILQTEGTIDYKIEDKKIENPYQFISLATPYLELIEEMTAIEFLEFHSKFKRLTVSSDEILINVQLQNAANKQIRYFSSGMKQRLKLAQAFFSESSVLLLDEPTTNLDEAGIALYHSLIKNFTNNRITIICSNDKAEYDFCKSLINVMDYK